MSELYFYVKQEIGAKRMPGRGGSRSNASKMEICIFKWGKVSQVSVLKEKNVRCRIEN